jgi:hypothetical protein
MRNVQFSALFRSIRRQGTDVWQCQVNAKDPERGSENFGVSSRMMPPQRAEASVPAETEKHSHSNALAADMSVSGFFPRCNSTSQRVCYRQEIIGAMTTPKEFSGWDGPVDEARAKVSPTASSALVTA